MKKVFYCLMVLTVFSCSSDSDSSAAVEDSNPMYIKSYKTLTAPEPGYYDAFYEYEDGFLTRGTGFNLFGGTFEYDDEGKLISRQLTGESYSYLYDSNDRLIKEIKDGTNDNTTLSYSANKIRVTKTYEIAGGTEYIEVSDIYTDSHGRVTKVRRITPTDTDLSMLQEYSYDDRNNITQIRYKENTHGSMDRTINFTYDNNKNPFYYAFKKLYKSIYYLECRTGVNNYKHTGVTPNNMVLEGTSSSFDHTYNSKGYPTQWFHTYENGGTTPAVTERTLEYY